MAHFDACSNLISAAPLQAPAPAQAGGGGGGQPLIDISWSGKEKGIDSIKRSILKDKIGEGGLNVTDVECLNRTLKLRQNIRANNTKHPINQIQKYCSEKLGYNNDGMQQEYNKIPKRWSNYWNSSNNYQ